MVKAAFVVWQDRIAPLFDTSRQTHIVEVLPDRTLMERSENLQGLAPVTKVMRLVEWDVSTLICGAISRQVQTIAAAHGIHVIPLIAGDLHAVIQAWLNNRLQDPEYKLPGCGPKP
jgi:predicted Fe-Mo cluster-binding NifX family protein